MAAAEPDFEPYVPASKNIAEFTWSAVVAGALLGIIFGASSLYLVLKVGLTVSASIPVAVLSITLFRVFSRIFGFRKNTILENNIVQTTGSAGESIAFGVGVTIPALMLLGMDMELTRVMTVGIFGGLLGILMMIPLRRAFIVKQHGKLKYPEGTACADVLIVGEEGGATAATVFTGFGLAFLHKFLMVGLHLWHEVVSFPLKTKTGKGLPGGEVGGELSPELLGVGYIIGPRIASIMLAGGVLAYLVITPLIVFFGSTLNAPLAPATELIRDMDAAGVRKNYILYIGAGAVATGGIISMFQALPMIITSLAAGLRDLRPGKSGEGETKTKRTDRDLPLSVVVLGALVLVLGLAAVPSLGLGVTTHGIIGACLIVVFGFLFVTVSSRLTGEIGSSSNPISGMTVATLLLTCLVFLAMGKTDRAATLTAMTVAAVVCVAASNGGTTSQDLKTGFLVGATPRLQQISILIGALTSAAVIGVILLMLNNAGTVWSKAPQNIPRYTVPNVKDLEKLERPGGQYAEDTKEYHVWHALEGEIPGVKQGKYLVSDNGQIAYLVDPGINGRLNTTDDGAKVSNKFEAPKTRLMALIIDGILQGKLPWELVLIGALIAIVLELSGVPSLPFAVGVYLPLASSVPIFIGGALRWFIDKVKRQSAEEADMSPGVLMSSGYIAGGAIAGVVVAFCGFSPTLTKFLDLSAPGPSGSAILPDWWNKSPWPSTTAFAVLMIVLLLTGFGAIFRGASPKAPAPTPKPAAKPRQN